MLDHIDNEDKVVTKVTAFGGEQRTTIINESGLFLVRIKREI